MQPPRIEQCPANMFTQCSHQITSSRLSYMNSCRQLGLSLYHDSHESEFVAYSIWIASTQHCAVLCRSWSWLECTYTTSSTPACNCPTCLPSPSCTLPANSQTRVYHYTWVQKPARSHRAWHHAQPSRTFHFASGLLRCGAQCMFRLCALLGRRPAEKHTHGMAILM